MATAESVRNLNDIERLVQELDSLTDELITAATECNRSVTRNAALTGTGKLLLEGHPTFAGLCSTLSAREYSVLQLGLASAFSSLTVTKSRLNGFELESSAQEKMRVQNALQNTPKEFLGLTTHPLDSPHRPRVNKQAATRMVKHYTRPAPSDSSVINLEDDEEGEVSSTS